MYLIRISTRSATFGLIEAGGRIVDGAPYGLAALKRAGITTARAAVLYFRERGADVSWSEIQTQQTPGTT